MAPRPFDDDEGVKSTLHQPRFAPSEAPDSAFRFSVVEGPDRGLVFALEAGQRTRVLVGTGASCELRLRDPSVSRRHAGIELCESFVRLTDMSSTNGTWVNGVSIMEALLRGGEHVRVGDNVLLVERDPAKESEVLPRRTSFGRVIGASREMRRVYGLCEPLAASTIPVVIEGETGTGKEALAEALHETGPRASGPFVVFDCTAVPSTLMEAELFGHERGAFTGATNKHAGVLEQAHGGTLLIDEIGDLDLALQPKLLRALERGEYRRIGGERSMRVDVRVIAATRRNLDREVEAGRFRDDLYHRMAVCRIELPPLRHRRGDVPTLAKAFCHDLGGDAARIPAHLIAKWDDYSWPGNVRELRNAVIRYLALGEKLSGTMHSTSAISMPSERDPLDDVATVAQRVISEGLPLVVARRMVVEAFEQRYLEATLARHGGVVTHAAAASGIARRHFQRLRARPR